MDGISFHSGAAKPSQYFLVDGQIGTIFRQFIQIPPLPPRRMGVAKPQTVPPGQSRELGKKRRILRHTQDAFGIDRQIFGPRSGELLAETLIRIIIETFPMYALADPQPLRKRESFFLIHCYSPKFCEIHL